MAPALTPDQITAFIRRCPDAGLVTLRADGRSHVARVEVAMVDGRLRSTGSTNLVRVRNLRRDPRCSVFVFDAHPWWLGIDGAASLIEGPAAGPALVQLLRARHPDTPAGLVNAHDEVSGTDQLSSEAEYLSTVADAGLLVIDVEIRHAYGNLPPATAAPSTRDRDR